MKILIASAILAASAGAQSAGGFITRLGNDTIAIERFARTRDSIVGELLTRSPKAGRVGYVVRMNPQGTVTTYTALFYASAAPGAPVRTRGDVDLRGPDSIRATFRRGDSTQRATVAYVAGSIPILEPAYGQYEIVTKAAMAAGGRRIPFNGYFVGDTMYSGSAIRAAPDLVLIATRTDTVRARVDHDGRIQSITDPGGTLQATVTRVVAPDLDAWAAKFAARDAQGKSLGALSPRDTVRATVGGVHVMVDYGRPSKRGRTIFGGVIPYNTVWRTGANEATTLIIDRDVTIGDTKVPAGEYTLFSLPTADAWTLIVSKRTKEWGTDYDPTADFARIPMQVSTSPTPAERFTIGVDPQGALSFAWDTRVARVNLHAGS
jgi:Protein of unknown function (DUF2911)